MAKTTKPKSKKELVPRPAAAKAPRASATKKGSKASSDKQPTLVPQSVAHEMMDGLVKLYPDADCELDFASTFQLLTAVILSAQTTDVQVNKCTPALFSKFPTAKDLAEGSLDEIKELIRPTGYFNAKAKNIQTCAEALVEKFGGEVPSNMEDLTSLPGVGRKTANVVLGVAFGVPGWTVDTHVQRLSKRLGFCHEADPAKIEIDLQKLFPDDDWSKFSITLIWHGRRMCYARNPDCPKCPINHLCPSSTV